jgi:hypothetical protein
MTTSNYCLKALLSLGLAMSLVACETGPPTVQTGPDAELSFDGLHKVDNSQADLAWARPDFDISVYTKLMPLPGKFEYRQVRKMSASAARSSSGPYFIDDNARAEFEELVGEVFREELQNIERFEWTDEPGPDVMTIQGALLDIVSFVPPEPIGGRSFVYLSSIGEATLVLELRDSETGTILARSVDREAAEPIGMTFTESNRVTNRADVGRLIRFWARRLREGLEGFAR